MRTAGDILLGAADSLCSCSSCRPSSTEQLLGCLLAYSIPDVESIRLAAGYFRQQGRFECRYEEGPSRCNIRERNTIGTTRLVASAAQEDGTRILVLGLSATVCGVQHQSWAGLLRHYGNAIATDNTLGDTF
ncbi:hypothetical protein S7711_10568 [Stachybotrys chartarum IBT 7711]|uniref:Uncharacterized protein n=1 Tax=Stachybotrys chartarum (strain CBS 109288 / IBT 7711) TaxID=1280523 RepID=A0A084B129_STACB|nr:hypothetical protein S7711_10568 [Stachybotrys chartarum IBT 7711]